MDVIVHPSAVAELQAIPQQERDAINNAVAKLQALGDQLGFPHSSAVKGADRIRELRPRSGRSPWRGFYRRVADVIVIAAFGPEASVDRREFEAAWQRAEQRLRDHPAEGGARDGSEVD